MKKLTTFKKEDFCKEVGLINPAQLVDRLHFQELNETTDATHDVPSDQTQPTARPSLCGQGRCWECENCLC